MMGMGAEGEVPAPPPPPSNEIVDITDKINKAECFVLNQVWVEGGSMDGWLHTKPMPSPSQPTLDLMHGTPNQPNK